MLQRIFSEGLNAQLEKGLAPCYLLSGQDLLLVNESKDAIVKHARQQQFDDKIEAALNNETKWDDLFEQVQSNGLFSQRQIVILNLPDALTAPQQKQLAALLAFSHADLLFILHAPKFNKQTEKQAWFSQIEAQTTVVNCQTPDIGKLPTWLNHRAKSMQLQLEPETVQFLCYSYEGNLLALKQVLAILQLQYADKPIGLNRAKEVVEQSAQFTPFQWVDALLSGKTARAVRILNHLQNEEVQPVVLLRIMQKELHILLEITRQPDRVTLSEQPLATGNLRTEFDRLKIWQNRRTLYQQFVQRHTYRKLYQLIQDLAELERQVKHDFSDTVWLELVRFSSQFS